MAATPSAEPTHSSRPPSPSGSHSSHSARTLADPVDPEKGDLRGELKKNDGESGDVEKGAGAAPAADSAKGPADEQEEDPFYVTPKGRMHLHPHTWSVVYRWFIVRRGRWPLSTLSLRSGLVDPNCLQTAFAGSLVLNASRSQISLFASVPDPRLTRVSTPQPSPPPPPRT